MSVNSGSLKKLKDLTDSLLSSRRKLSIVVENAHAVDINSPDIDASVSPEHRNVSSRKASPVRRYVSASADAAGVTSHGNFARCTSTPSPEATPLPLATPGTARLEAWAPGGGSPRAVMRRGITESGDLRHAPLLLHSAAQRSLLSDPSQVAPPQGFCARSDGRQCSHGRQYRRDIGGSSSLRNPMARCSECGLVSCGE